MRITDKINRRIHVLRYMTPWIETDENILEVQSAFTHWKIKRHFFREWETERKEDRQAEKEEEEARWTSIVRRNIIIIIIIIIHYDLCAGHLYLHTPETDHVSSE
jgi:hypothetical protein